ncbi:uncharacterized protein BDR25DRAFT_359463 [Lindgomyces ingoldianus]|uniref:Uncharacterized protein n=1 Tax=Lindgomyces ingoldianus TaxID=673940 RepID=A0ACB6QKA4_9PLEO|nr:uncharacterized protein BDR25DRAFT_359463 [Lindgomyces ingoldianus]KAF2466566.1 hypothetical protein BDR25DRAFT_359463 [Lindgomyces ingoldianus]
MAKKFGCHLECPFVHLLHIGDFLLKLRISSFQVIYPLLDLLKFLPPATKTTDFFGDQLLFVEIILLTQVILDFAKLDSMSEEPSFLMGLTTKVPVVALPTSFIQEWLRITNRIWLWLGLPLALACMTGTSDSVFFLFLDRIPPFIWTPLLLRSVLHYHDGSDTDCAKLNFFWKARNIQFESTPKRSLPAINQPKINDLKLPS